jgi:HK97 family phage portal protein
MGRTMLGAILNRVTAQTNTPVPFASRAQSYALGGFGRRGTTAELESMGSVSTLFAIVNRTAKAEAQVDWKLFRKAKSGKDEDRVEVTSHAALDLWNRPNAFYTQSVFVEAGAQHKQLTGEQWWIIARDERSPIPLELWPVRPDRMRPVPDPEKFISGYMYTGPNGEQVALRIEDVIFIRTPHPTDPYRGIGPVQALLTDLDAVRYSAEWNRNFFLNSAEPGGIIEVPNALSDPDFDQLRERWNEQHRGVANAHRVAILEHGVWKDRKYSQRDMQFVELRHVGQEIIREAFGFPKPMLGTVDDVNRANADAGEVMFARWLCVPDLEAVKDALNNQLLPLFGARDLEFDFENPVPEDRELAAKELAAKAAAVRELVDAGVYGPEALEAVGLPVMAFGQPGADQDRELLIKLVTGAPLLAPTILPMLGFTMPDPPAAPKEPAASEEPEAATNALPLGPEMAAMLGIPDVQAAQRWVAVSEDDDNTCEPCRDNAGQTYRNRAAAYRDYPGGSGYIHCVGAEFGNDCRCKVVKRGKSNEGEE